MKTRIIISFISAAFLFISCEEPLKGKISVTNSLDNVSLEQICMDGHTVSYQQLLPGQTITVTFSDDMYSVEFPMAGYLEFYMTSGENTIYLRTSEYFELNAGGHLRINIAEDTEVVNGNSTLAAGAPSLYTSE